MKWWLIKLTQEYDNHSHSRNHTQYAKLLKSPLYLSTHVFDRLTTRFSTMHVSLRNPLSFQVICACAKVLKRILNTRSPHNIFYKREDEKQVSSTDFNYYPSSM